MGVSLFVMPLRVYLTGRFRTAGPGPVSSLSDLEAGTFVSGLKRSLEPLLGTAPEWDEDAAAESASSLSYSGYGRPVQAAGRYAGVRDFPLLRRLEELTFFLPVPFGGALEVPHPLDPDREFVVGSSARLKEEFLQLERLLLEEPEAEELASLPPGSVVTGLLAEYCDDLRTVRHLGQVAGLSVDRRLPLIVER